MGKENVVVIGLGRFGSSLAKTLSEYGHEVLALDTNMKMVENAAEFVTQAAQVDATDENALVEMGVRNFDVGVVAMGSDIKSSILVALLLKKLGVKTVIARAHDDLHGEILEKVGADSVVYPDRETGIRVAHALTTPNLVDYMEIMPRYGIAKVVVPQALSGKRLEEIDLKGRFGIKILILCRRKEVIVNPSKNEIVNAGDTLVVTGTDEDLKALRAV
ncbi:MAG: TrkA family potassium uptake protein [Chloroflexi bacterium]|nr:TrkA family potassium uptake protein [Chloroflexota bacterium]MDA8189878.1 TrkA family potassium uptake protein [Dehalococcoidales bacterium]